jgi:hypothetical protein
MDMAEATLKKAMLLENQAALALFTISVGSLEGDKAVEYVQLRRVEEMRKSLRRLNEDVQPNVASHVREAREPMPQPIAPAVKPFLVPAAPTTHLSLHNEVRVEDFGEDFHNTIVGREAIQGPSLETDIPIEYELM